MIRKRIGKDLRISWRVTTNGEHGPLAGRDLRLEVSDGVYNTVMPFLADGDTIHFTWYGREQKHTGTYSFVLWENPGQDNQTIIDYCNAIELVAHSCQEGDEGTGDVYASDIKVNINTIVVDRLDSSSPFEALSANQGRVLKESIDSIHDIESIREQLGKSYIIGNNPQVVVHNLGHRPSVTVTDPSGRDVSVDIVHVDEKNSFYVTWNPGEDTDLTGGTIYVI